MIDQATELRKLSLDHGRQVNSQHSGSSRLLVVSGGKGGVGSTTIAVQLATALATLKQKVLLVEVGDYRSDITTLCELAENTPGLNPRSRSDDLTSMIQQGPAGIHVLPATWQPPGQATKQSPAQIHHLFQQLQRWQNDYDILLADVSNRTQGLASRLSEYADDLLLVTTCEPVAIMDSYAMLKIQSQQGTLPRVHIIVNRIVFPGQGHAIYQRINHACQRFLGFPVDHLGSLPERSQQLETAGDATANPQEDRPAAIGQACLDMAEQLMKHSCPPVSDGARAM
ncbi:MAG: AAA family ATPase [Pirellulaceae bacterium]